MAEHPAHACHTRAQPLSLNGQSSHLMALRDSRGQPVSHWPTLVLPSTCILVTREYGGRQEILCHQRSDNGWWGFVGGAQNPGESLEECARRETQEETGLTVLLVQLIGIDSDPRHGSICVYPDGNVVQYTCVSFRAIIAPHTDTTLRCSAESLTLRWCTPETLPEPFLPLHRRRLDMFLQACPGMRVSPA